MVLFSDLDHTLQSPEDPMVLATNLLAVRKWRAAGNSFIIVTEHSYPELDNILPDWQKFANYAITDNGGVIFSNQDQCIYICRLELRLVRAIQSLVCDRGLPMSYGIDRCSIELLLGEAIIKLRLYFRTETLYYRYRERIEKQNWPIKVLPWPHSISGYLPGGTNLNQFFGFLDIIPEHSGREQAMEWLTQAIYPEQHIIATDETATSVADLIYWHL